MTLIQDIRNGLYVNGNLSGINLKRANLIGVNLSGADLYDTNLENAILENANLTRAFLISAKARYINLTGANLTNADLTNADLTGADLTGADLTGAILEQADIIEANLQGANLQGANLKGTDFSASNLEGANLEGANLTRTNMAYANLRGTNLVGANLTDTDFRGTNFEEAIIQAIIQSNNIQQSQLISTNEIGKCYILDFPNNFVIHDILMASETPLDVFLEEDPNNLVFINFRNDRDDYQGWGININDIIVENKNSLVVECRNGNGRLRNSINDVFWDKWYNIIGVGTNKGILASNLTMIKNSFNDTSRLFFLSEEKFIDTIAGVDVVFMDNNMNVWNEEINLVSKAHCQAGNGIYVYDSISIADINVLSSDKTDEEKRIFLQSHNDICTR